MAGFNEHFETWPEAEAALIRWHAPSEMPGQEILKKDGRPKVIERTGSDGIYMAPELFDVAGSCPVIGRKRLDRGTFWRMV